VDANANANIRITRSRRTRVPGGGFVVDGIGWAVIAVLVRELFFVELLEEFPPPRTWGPGAVERQEPQTA
jgi:hypothetical protein